VASIQQELHLKDLEAELSASCHPRSPAHARTSVLCGLCEHPVKAPTIEVPSMPIWVEDEMIFVELLLPPNTEDARRGGVPVTEELIPYTEIDQ
jgi:hypothetical protein